MANYIIIGSASSREEFISSYLRDQSIAPYNVLRFDERMGIEAARTLRMTFSQRVSSPRVVIITAGMTNDAQNALLKSFEELSEMISVFLSVQSEDELLPTVRSRFFIKMLSAESVEVPSTLLPTFRTAGSRLAFIDTLLAEHSKLTASELMDMVVGMLHEKLLTGSNEERRVVISILRRLFAIMPLVKNNNVNVRFALESTFLASK